VATDLEAARAACSEEIAATDDEFVYCQRCIVIEDEREIGKLA